MDESGTVVASTPEEVLHRLEWQVIRRLDGLLQGDYRTIFRGAGLDFRDVREYEPGDDVRRIDWNVTARMTDDQVLTHFLRRQAGGAMRRDRFFWRAYFGILLGVTLGLWLWIILDDFV